MVRVLLFFFLLICPTLAGATERPAQLQFADSLQAEGDYYRAITEYKRFIFEQPDSSLVPDARLAIASSLIAGKRWQQADHSLEQLFLLHPQSPEAAKGRLLYAGSAYERGNFGLARQRYRTLQQQATDPETINYTNFRIGWTFLEQDRPQKAGKTFSLLPSPQKMTLLKDVANYQALPQKSPLVAGSLSAVLPGAGQLYTGRTRQALLSFTLNSLFILASLEAFDNENYAVGGILLFFEAGWYGGNIYNAVNNTHKYNQRQKHQFREKIRSQLNLRLGMRTQTPWISLSYQF